MKNIFAYLIVILISIIFYACDKNEIDETLIGKWEVIELYKDSLIVPQNDNQYIFDFENDTTLNVKLDVNSCFGQYSIVCDDCIEFKGFGCTEACCDSKYAEDIIKIVSESTSYNINDDKLTLKGSGEVVLKKVNE